MNCVNDPKKSKTRQEGYGKRGMAFEGADSPSFTNKLVVLAYLRIIHVTNPPIHPITYLKIREEDRRGDH